MIKGQGVSKGFGIGRVYFYKNKIEIPKYKIDDIDGEILRLNDALEVSVNALDELYNKSLDQLGDDKAQLFKAHEMMLKDPEFLASIKDKIKSYLNAEQAVYSSSKAFEEIFLQMDNDYFRERAADIKDVSERLICALMSVEKKDLSYVAPGSILVAEDLSPSDTSQLNKENIVGIVTEIGGHTSHSAIIARTLGIPAIMGVGSSIYTLEDNMSVIIDGDSGHLIMNPDETLIDKYTVMIEERKAYLNSLETFRDANFAYSDGRPIEIAGNIALPEESELVLYNGGQGIGLFRSEFIFMNRSTPPSEEEQYQAYKKALTIMKGKPVTIRTMDIGGDKAVDYLKIDEELNPFLGYRAIRYCFDHVEFFKTQIRALLRSSLHGHLRIMFPMVSTVKELRDIHEIIDQVKEDMTKDNIEFGQVQIGIMIEVPSAALMSDQLAKYVDFASIGTNDLTQYTLACDRMNPNVKNIYSNYDPAVIRLVKMTIDNFHKAGKWVGMCGSAAGNVDLIPVWYALGLDEFSMVPGSILEAKSIIDTIDKYKIDLDTLLGFEDEKQIKKYLRDDKRHK